MYSDNDELFPLSDRHKIMANKEGILPNVLYFQATDMPQIWLWADWIQSDLTNDERYAVPELKIFTLSNEDAKLLIRNKVQFHLKEHNIQNTNLVHLLFCIRDVWPNPFIVESLINPSESNHKSFVKALATSPMLLLNVYQKGIHKESRYIENPVRVTAATALQKFNLIPEQSIAAFIEAKTALQNKMELNHRNFEWTDPMQATIATGIKSPKAPERKLRKSMEGLGHMVQSRPYPNLPEDLKEYHFWIADVGHSIMCIPTVLWDVAAKSTLDDMEVAAPVKYLIVNGYTIKDGYVTIDAPYDPVLGLDIDDEYYEY
ncbi:hypothetical protein [Paenibacillus terrae]|uniref:Uncharacterized protein n=1 Tax=Paenibacillus terrae TaxID=159743 RepID=A0A0D7WY37_9BACL|nr:hypothetical protein [Paenibacillus terrae]KJD42657.1 hypothetical protein QD47_26985 [Paenibacillus terrae]